MTDNVFRKKSIERIASPEQLNDYIRVSSPGVWLMLLAIAVLLAGICVWAAFGHLDTKLDTAVLSRGGTSVCYISEADGVAVRAGMSVSVNGEEYTVLSMSPVPVQIGGAAGDYYLHLSGLSAGDWAYLATLDASLPDGVYPARIIIDRVSPVSFVLN